MTRTDHFAIMATLYSVIVGMALCLGIMCSTEPVTATPPLIIQRPPALPPAVGPLAAVVGDEADLTPGLPLTYEPPTYSERLAVAAAIGRCRRVSESHADHWLVLATLRVERALGMPERLLASAVCHESAMGSPDAVGDGGEAIGPLQAHPVWVGHCWDGSDRRTEVAAIAPCLWAYATGPALKRLMRLCERRGQTARHPLLTAWSRVTGGSARYGTCNALGDHAIEAGL